MMKNELGGLRIATEFVALKFKMYAYRKVDREDKNCEDYKCLEDSNLLYEE